MKQQVQEKHGRDAGAECVLILNTVMPHRRFQHLWAWADYFLHAVALFVNLESWINSNILSIRNGRALFNINLKSMINIQCKSKLFNVRQVELYKISSHGSKISRQRQVALRKNLTACWICTLRKFIDGYLTHNVSRT